MFKVNNKDTRTTPLVSFWCLYCYLLTHSIPCYNVFIINFEDVIAGWGRAISPLLSIMTKSFIIENKGKCYVY